MRLEIQTKPGSKFPSVEKLTNERWIIKVRQKAIDGQANDAVCEVVALELGVSKSKVKIFRGERSRVKILEIDIG